jgi:hypothetical protein
MSLSFPTLVSTDDNLNSYCNYIEYSCFVDGDIFFSEFDTDDGGLKLDDIVPELERRLGLYGDFVPYKIFRDRIESLLLEKNDYLHYIYCLYYAIKGGNSKANNTNIFELITDVSLKNYFTTEYSEITSIGQNPTNLKNSIDRIRIALLETKGNYDHIAPQAKDGGIDIVTYKPIDDRGNQLVCLTDATIGKNWKSQKKVASKLDYWCEYLHFKVRPLTCLSIVHIVDESEFYNASKDNGLIFDRPRIMRYFKSENTLTTRLTTWLSNL